MKTCTYPDCDRLTEGNTDYCGTHNREIRKQQNAKMAFAKPNSRDVEYNNKVKKWKIGRKCALKDHSNCWGPLTCHHRKGRQGDLLMDEKHWLPVCLGHHRYIETHPTEAYDKGWSELRLQKEPHNI